jgi:hypothetical protein
VPGTPPPALKPLSGPTPPPKPPSLGAKPTVPLRPSPAAPAAPEAPKAAPKKETARITLPTEGAKQLPKATVRMQQTQPLVSRPAPALTPAPAAAAAAVTVIGSDPAVDKIAIAAFVFSIAAVVMAFLAFSASPIPPFQ